MRGDWQEDGRLTKEWLSVQNSTAHWLLIPLFDCVMGFERGPVHCRSPHIGTCEEGPVWLWQGEDEVHRERAGHSRWDLLDHRMAEI